MAINTHYITSASDLPAATNPSGRLARAGGWWTLILSLLTLLTLAEAILAAQWSEGLEVIRPVILGSALLCFLLALTRWRAPFVILYGGIASIVWVTFWLVRVALPGYAVHEGIQELVVRNGAWIAALINKSASADNLVFLTQLSLLCWWLAFFAIWSLFRHQSVAYAAVPLAAALIVNLHFSPYNLRLYLVVFLISVLLLAVRVEMARNESLWQFTRVRYPADISLDFWKGGAVFALMVLALSLLAPDLNNNITLERIMRPFEQPWRTFTDTWARMYESVTYPTTTATVTSFGRSMSLGGPVALTDRPIFEAYVPARSYWRAAAYDTYTGEGWVNTDPETRVVERDQPLGEPGFFMYREITSTVRPLEVGQETIFGPPQPVRISVPTDVDVMPLDQDATLFSASMLRSRIRFDPGDSYRVISAVSLAPPDNLRNESAAQPEWVARYLQLPASVPQRVLDLAREYAGDNTNPYDIASAVESRLREYAYNQSISRRRRELTADYFLFDLREGYCDYYARALAVMLRSLGIPTRMVVGYSPGDYIPPPPEDAAAIGKYLVLERHAHAWVEAYFPTYGWIQFEPTASEPLLTRPESMSDLLPSTTPTPPYGNDLQELEDLRNQRESLGPLPPASSGVAGWIRRNWELLVAALAVVIASALAWRIYRRRQASFYGSVDLISRLFAWLGIWAGRLHVPWPDSFTAMERVDAFGRKMPDASPALTRLALLFTAERYGRQQLADADLGSPPKNGDNSNRFGESGVRTLRNIKQRGKPTSRRD
jgi:transglutaminase-like putative cysteine protease